MTDLTTDKWELWIKVVDDPLSLHRGFSIEGREFKCLDKFIHEEEAFDFKTRKILLLKGYRVAIKEFVRVVPEIVEWYNSDKSKPSHTYWFMPRDFVQPFMRPCYVKPSPWDWEGIKKGV